ncbi:MAG: ABC transporter ATP-binding protein/permease [Oscillospiraceae bacterium]|nr:ABC transporter ATP-binding protein/permease [Oscillospiraceae bacterium]
MLQIREISKKYVTGTLVQTALDSVSLNLRDNEFVAVLGPSGSGKTTLLNVIGGLDRYDSGDLIINGISTQKYKDRDWDSYRNHTIGFVFQSYNLIPHQSVLANVELALTISGIGRTERRKRAKQALERVGLGDQLHKKPNQMSGGQMQRVAIARALINNPDILLADEPTGALDTETSEQVMQLLKEVAKDRLVVMVTHNQELAEKYATRIVKLRDGRVTDDSNPYDVDSSVLEQAKHKNMGKSSMSFLTSISLSFNNLRTKKGRTLLTAFAGSIGIIGIALILALSTGVNTYIADIQKDTMTSYPITISAESIDLTSVMSSRGSRMGQMMGNNTEEAETRTGIFADNSEIESESQVMSSVTENDLTSFKKYLDDPNSEIQQYLGENGIVYSYNVNFDVFTKDADGNYQNTNLETDSDSSSAGMMGAESSGMMSRLMGTSSSSGAENFEELMPGSGGEMVSKVTTDSYDVLYGSWPQSYNEVVLVLDENNSISTSVLYQLGLITKDQYQNIEDQIENGEEADVPDWSYEDLNGYTFYLIPSCDYYVNNEDGTFTNVGEDTAYEQQLIDSSIKLKVVGVVRPVEDAANASLTSAVAYTSALTDHIVEHANSSAVVTAQEAAPDINVLNGLPFEAASNAEKIENAKTYLSELGVSDKASMYQMILYSQTSTESADSSDSSASNGASGMSGMTGTGNMDETTLAAALDQWISQTPDDTILLSVYDTYLGDSSYKDNIEAFGKVSYDAPTSISIYTDSFDDKEAVSDCIENYNKTAGEDEQITYTDYVALLTSSITSIVNVISYVLIAFVAVSLIVSCIMIGIITHISVLERTKEIGILRAIGASKRNISQVFNAETFIIGLCSGVLGVGISELLTIPINAIIHALIGAATVSANLPIGYAAVLILISMAITMLGGLMPARNAAKKDPVTALRTE